MTSANFPKIKEFFDYWCSGRDLNSHGSRHCPLKTACLPIPPHRLMVYRIFLVHQLLFLQLVL